MTLNGSRSGGVDTSVALQQSQYCQLCCPELDQSGSAYAGIQAHVTCALAEVQYSFMAFCAVIIEHNTYLSIVLLKCATVWDEIAHPVTTVAKILHYQANFHLANFS